MEYLRIISEFEIVLKTLESSNIDIISKAEAGIEYTEVCLNNLRNEVLNHEFNSVEEEIKFFKYVKPQIFSKLIYYVNLFKIESRRPRSSKEFQIKYYNNHINDLQLYFNDNIEFYHYYRRGATTLDENYFVRGKTDLRFPKEPFQYYIDSRFKTCQDITVATIIAYELLIEHVQEQIDDLNQHKSIQDDTFKNSSTTNLSWTSSKTALTELIYALHHSRSINNGNADIKEIAIMFQKILHFDIGDYYKTFSEIKSRKISRTKFLDDLASGLLSHMTNSEE